MLKKKRRLANKSEPVRLKEIVGLATYLAEPSVSILGKEDPCDAAEVPEQLLDVGLLGVLAQVAHPEGCNSERLGCRKVDRQANRLL